MQQSGGLRLLARAVGDAAVNPGHAGAPSYKTKTPGTVPGGKSLLIAALLRCGGCARHNHSGDCGRCCFSQNAVMNRKQRQLKPVGYANLVVYVTQVVLDDLLGGAELVCDLFVLV